MSKEGANRRCLNCKRPIQLQYCGGCGQQNLPLKLPVWGHFGQIIGEHLSLDSRAVRTFVPFLLRPGFLTREFNAGRRVHYSSPLRLYLLMSVLLFLGLGISRFITDFAVVQQLPTAEAREPWEPEGIELPMPGGAVALADPAAKALGTLTEHLSVPPSRYQARISRTVQELLGDEHPLSRYVSRKMTKLRQMDWAEARLAGFDNWLNLLPTAMFLLMPFCAVLLKLCLLGSRRYYAEHFVFTLHLHAFTFLVLLALCLFWSPAAIALGTAVIVAYIFLAMRTAYRLGVVDTLVRGSLFVVSYVVLLLAGLGATFGISLMML